MLRIAAALLILASPAAACAIAPFQQTDMPESLTEVNGIKAWYSGLTDRYPHGALGDGFEPETLHIYSSATATQCGLRMTLNETHVFEDTAPRLADLNGDGTFEIITTRSHRTKGAQIAVYDDQLTLIATTPYIGTRNRWLAPIGIADLDNNGSIEIAYIDRPHLAKTLRIWRFSNGTLTPIARAEGLTNHRFGAPDIIGGLQTCKGQIRLITANADWSRVMSTMLTPMGLNSEDLGPYSEAAVTKALTCD